jgi:hypothetical protein
MMIHDKLILEKLLLRTSSTEEFTDINRTNLNSVFTDFKSIIKKLNDNDPNTFNGVANLSEIIDAKELIIESKSVKEKRDSYNDFRDRLIGAIEWTIAHLN